MNSLEKFLKENRNAFDREEPSEKHFANMKHRLGFSETHRKFRGLKYAAVFVGLFAIVTVTGLFLHQTKQLPQNIRETQLYYSLLIEQKVNRLQQQKSISDCQLQQIRKEIASSQIPVADFFASAQENPNNDYVINAIIRQYQLQIQIIDNIVTHKYFCRNRENSY